MVPIGYVVCTLIHFGVYWWYLQKKMHSMYWLLILFVPFGWLFLLSLPNLNVDLIFGDYEEEEEEEEEEEDSGSGNYDED